MNTPASFTHPLVRNHPNPFVIVFGGQVRHRQC